MPFNVDGLLDRIKEKEASVGVIGLGYVGLPLALAFASQGFRTVGFDVDPVKPAKLETGESYFAHIPTEEIIALWANGRLRATTDFAGLAEMDAIIICVPTPLSENNEPDLKFVEDTAHEVAKHLRSGQLVTLESTTYPGTSRDVLKPILEAGGLKSGEDFLIAYSPEREDPGNLNFKTTTIAKIVGGDGEHALRVASTLYQSVISQIVPVSSLEAAEATKLTENIFRAVNIAMVNELKIVYEALDIDVWEVIDAAKTKPFGYMPFYPGPGLGGHCIPIDPFYLTWRARQAGMETRFIELAGRINSAMPAHVVTAFQRALKARFEKAILGARVLLIGIAYKKNVDDVRESPAFKIIELLEEAGAEVDFHDPMVSEIPETREYMNLSGRKSVSLTPECVRSYDGTLICTDHDSVDYAMLVASSPIVVDTRNATKNITQNRDKIIKA